MIAEIVGRELRDGDVFRFSYSAEQRANMFEPYHCFDGQLVYRDGFLRDTYWGFDARGEGGRYFTPTDAAAKGTLTFVCNLDDVETVSEHDFPQYEEADRFDLSHEHRCYKKFAVRKGAKKSVRCKLAILDERVKKAQFDMDWARRTIERCAEERARLEAGEDIYI